MKLYHESRGQGSTLLLLHGWGMHSGVWDCLADRLADRHRIILADLPGHGYSPLPPGNYDLDRLSDMAASLLTDDTTLLGWSLGGMVAMELARRYPQQVKRLVLVGSTPQFFADDNWPVAMPATTLAEFSRALRANPDQTLRRFLALQVRTSCNAAQVLRKLQTQLARRQTAHPAALANGLGILSRSNLRPHLQQIHCPVLLLHGDQDQLVPVAAAAALCRLLPHASLLRFAGAGHAPFLSHPDDFIHALNVFTHDTTTS